MELKEAKRLSIIKWETVMNAGGDGDAVYFSKEVYLQVENLLHTCGLCEYTKRKTGLSVKQKLVRQHCYDICPLPKVLDGKSCFENFSVYREWAETDESICLVKATPEIKEKRLKLATQILTAIESIQIPEENESTSGESTEVHAP